MVKHFSACLLRCLQFNSNLFFSFLLNVDWYCYLLGWLLSLLACLLSYLLLWFPENFVTFLLICVCLCVCVCCMDVRLCLFGFHDVGLPCNSINGEKYRKWDSGLSLLWANSFRHNLLYSLLINFFSWEFQSKLNLHSVYI